MNNTPQHLKDKWATEKPVCVRASEGNCQGRMTKDHTIIFAGKQVQEDWAIVDVCAFHHGVDQFQDCGDLNREKHTHYALQKAQNCDLKRFSKCIDYVSLKEKLETKYGK